MIILGMETMMMGILKCICWIKGCFKSIVAKYRSSLHFYIID